jgi:hypothetical protein
MRRPVNYDTAVLSPVGRGRDTDAEPVGRRYVDNVAAYPPGEPNGRIRAV